MSLRAPAENENADFVMPARIAGIQVRKDAPGDIHVSLDSSAPCWNDAIDSPLLELTEARPPLFSREITMDLDNSFIIPAAAGIQVRVGGGIDTGFRRYDMRQIFACGSAALGPLWCTFFLVSLVLAGCGSFSPKPDPSRFFTLTAIAQPGATPANDSSNLAGVSLGIGPVRLPGYLDREEIVTRVSPNRIDFSEYDRWAEPLDASFTRILGQNLSVLLHTDRLVFYPWELNRRPNYQVTVQVVRFESNDRGEVQLSARWEIFDISNINRIPLRAGESGITRQPTASSTDASVAALSEALGDLSREITNAVNAVDGQRK